MPLGCAACSTHHSHACTEHRATGPRCTRQCQPPLAGPPPSDVARSAAAVAPIALIMTDLPPPLNLCSLLGIDPRPAVFGHKPARLAVPPACTASAVRGNLRSLLPTRPTNSLLSWAAPIPVAPLHLGSPCVPVGHELPAGNRLSVASVALAFLVGQVQRSHRRAVRPINCLCRLALASLRARARALSLSLVHTRAHTLTRVPQA